uniref:DNA (cytosine-5-)-methyltransferase n=1 Tax=Kalanchoe fedtschenkoi TaxID=63787 RepID=A0A7N0U315_KALFE
MGFPEEHVVKAVKENGEESADLILETLLTYSASPLALQSSPEEDQPPISIIKRESEEETDQSSSDYYENLLEDFSDADSLPEDEDTMTPLSDNDNKLLFLMDMGYDMDESSIAIERCGPDSSIDQLTDFISAAQLAKGSDHLYRDAEDEDKCQKKRKRLAYLSWKKKNQRPNKKICNGEDELMKLPKPMVGFGVPNQPYPAFQRTLPEDALGPLYFYYENVALAPKGVWNTISRYLYDIHPEFVDSKFFCACARKRGYIHNLPVGNRFRLLPIPAATIQDAFPLSKKWWPAWDTRTKLNCLKTTVASAKTTEKIRKALEDCDGDPPLVVQKYVMEECRKWNLVWIGKNRVATLEPDEFEVLLGFPKNHTRGGGSNRTDRFKSLGNSFQIDTVAYHLSVLKPLFPTGITVLSLFSGIGGAEVSLHRLNIPLKSVVSVEISQVNRNIVRSWWEQTNQRGCLIELEDVQLLSHERLEQLIHSVGGFDLVIGGSPCNNLAGCNRVSRDGLDGKESALFFDYWRILDSVKCIQKNRQKN